MERTSASTARATKVANKTLVVDEATPGDRSGRLLVDVVRVTANDSVATAGDTRAMNEVDVAVVGAGPYGLSVAAHLSGRARVRVFGRPMRTWREQMPQDMLLRSDWLSTNLSAPGEQGSLDQWAKETGVARAEPIALATFLLYAEWFRRRFVPDVSGTDVACIERVAERYRLVAVDGRETWAKQVVLAPGVTPFARVPELLRGFDHPGVVSATKLPLLESFRDLRVAIIGAGQNGLEAAYRLEQAGARQVEVFARSRVHWFADHEPHRERSRLGHWLYRLAYPIVGFGPPPVNRIVLRPDWYARMPEWLRVQTSKRLMRAGGSPWLRAHIGASVTFHEQTEMTRVEPTGDHLRVVTNTRGIFEVDRIVIACGFAFDVDRITVLAPGVRALIQTSPRTGWPVLSKQMETTCPGLFFVGYPAEGAFGPLSRFVEGTRFAGERCAAAILAG